MLRETVPTVDEFWAQTASAIPDFPPQEKRIAIVLLRELAKGKPVAPEQLGAALGVEPATAQAYLERPALASFASRDKEGRVAGFCGLSTVRTRHSFQVGEVQLWTWCAPDTLFLPAVLEQTAQVRTADPESGAEIHPSRLAARNRDGQTQWRGGIFPAARFRHRAGVGLEHHENVLPLQFLFCVTRIGQALDGETPRHVLASTGNGNGMGDPLQRPELRAERKSAYQDSRKAGSVIPFTEDHYE